MQLLGSLMFYINILFVLLLQLHLPPFSLSSMPQATEAEHCIYANL